VLTRPANVSLVVDRDHYEKLVMETVSRARVSLWIASANVKEMMLEPPIGSVARARKKYVSILETFADLTKKGVEIRMLHAATPSRAFRSTLARGKLARPGFEMRACPRVHLKMIAVDGASLYLGSANFTGAGLGAKGDRRRNFEMGILTDDEILLDAAQERFEKIWSGGECKGCRVRSMCPRPLDR
jgi:phosphatidylserine/phosphatidylglycerophosphate/cardiolipin synthase-like enzyme